MDHELQCKAVDINTNISEINERENETSQIINLLERPFDGAKFNKFLVSDEVCKCKSKLEELFK